MTAAVPDAGDAPADHPLRRLWRYDRRHRRRMAWAAAWTTVDRFAVVVAELWPVQAGDGHAARTAHS